VASDPSRILLPDGMRPSPPKLEPHIVTVQYSFRVDAPNATIAENIAAVGITFNTKLAMALLASGIQAEPFTKEAVEKLGFNMEEIERGRTNPDR